ncbi:hypothetical protein SARC_13141 [Sphaeroforma arctica JP610]|uniref:Alpha-ketoglutarate-dependent dioxygenase AlkB-like domain-containing protein n=1 Tax=Sphaeroforma arctica JP610 TaxID=667725 RepID=A0A0L0FC11_9EUKA|nr:hypothetical protein SARC_13141 [Sphaeroforma arctica JP610]KNC74307.1 hypothetical protein SARC_13141 [Sphaeroforma arctica JP610]|eukprot:XP_014148209.1 hypothetical protein SARC_13141 [Sphaeroforma arctica JP610]
MVLWAVQQGSGPSAGLLETTADKKLVNNTDCTIVQKVAKTVIGKPPSPRRSPHKSPSKPIASKVRRDRDKAKRQGQLIETGVTRSGPSVVFKGFSDNKNLQPIGLTFEPDILAGPEAEYVLGITSKVPSEKRSPWSTEGLGGRYQKAYYINDEQVTHIQACGYNWNPRRMKHQTVTNPTPEEDPGQTLLTSNAVRGFPMETLTERVQRLCPVVPGHRAQLLAMQVNWMKGSDFPSHKDLPDKEGWGDIIAAISLGSGGDLVIKDPVTEQAWTMHVNTGIANM